jgi:MFS family permease
MRLMPALRPLRNREFRLLTAATLTSVLGDGMMRVALPLQVLAISQDDPLAVGFLGIAWAVGQAISLPFGGVASDRYDRRDIMITSDLVRAVAIGLMGVLGVSGALELSQVVALGLSFGFANGFFNPAARSLIPDLIAEPDLPQANALLGFARPLQLWVVGPLLGGLIVGVRSPGAALIIDALTFVASAALLARLGRRGPADASDRRSVVAEAREGLRYVARTRWAKIWFAAGGLSTLAFHGPFDVLVPTMLKTDVGLSEAAAAWWMALIFASGGVGALAVSTAIGHRGLPRRFMLWLYGAEALSLFGLATFAYMTRLWQALVIGLVVFGAIVLSEIIGDTNLQREVPRNLLGRVTSLEWFVAIGLTPISFAIAGPLGRAFGPRPVLVTIGVIAGTVIAALVALPDARSPEAHRRPSPPVGEESLAQTSAGGAG